MLEDSAADLKSVNAWTCRYSWNVDQAVWFRQIVWAPIVGLVVEQASGVIVGTPHLHSKPVGCPAVKLAWLCSGDFSDSKVIVWHVKCPDRVCKEQKWKSHWAQKARWDKNKSVCDVEWKNVCLLVSIWKGDCVWIGCFCYTRLFSVMVCCDDSASKRMSVNY